MLADRIRASIREVPDFPKPGINFKDITPILTDPVLCHDIALALAEQFSDAGVDAVVGVESRGFLFGIMAAQNLQVPFIPIRKKGKLPYQTVSHKYALEYGEAEVEMHVDAVSSGDRIMVHDDLLATGGTAAAAAELVHKQGGTVAGFSFLVELGFLQGRQKLETYDSRIINLVSYT